MPGPSVPHVSLDCTGDAAIATRGVNHPDLTTQKSSYVEISRARDRAKLVTDDAAELRAQLQAVTGERIAALEGIGEMKRETPGKAFEAALPGGRQREHETGPRAGKGGERPAAARKTGSQVPGRGRASGRDFGL